MAVISAATAICLAACGGGDGADAGSRADAQDGSSTNAVAQGGATGSRSQAAGVVGDAGSTDAATTAAAAATTIKVRAMGSLLYNVGPQMQIRVNGSVVAQVEVRASAFQDYSFKVSAVPAGARVDVVFTNDARNSTADRNLWVAAITVNGTTMSPTDAGVTYDRGFGTSAFDGVTVIPGQQFMAWAGALRFVAPAAAAPVAPAPTINAFAPMTGAAGSTVVINGSGLDTVTQVTFDGVASPSLTGVTATTISAVVPTGATTGKIAVISGSTTVVSTEDFTVPVAPATSYEMCQASAGAHKVTDFGVFVAGVPDATTRTTNTATINAALDTVGKQANGGTVCLPPGVFYLTNRPGEKEAVVITHNNTTLWGAGMSGSAGGTHLVTRSDWNLVGGQVLRGFGMRLVGTQSASAPLNNVTLRDFELDGGAGYTGKFDWPANPANGDGWDITHKGLLLAADACANNITLQRLWIHAYRGEIIYAGGQCLQKVTIDGIKSEDTNASTFNITANLTVTNSYFGKSSIWMEVGAAGPYNSSTWTNNTFKDAARYGINIAQGDGRANTPHVFKNNSFTNCGNTAFFLGGGAGGPITISNNTFQNCSGFTSGYAYNDKGWAKYENKLVTFENNTLTDVTTLAFLGSSLTDSAIRGNKVYNTTGNVGSTTATFLCDSDFSGVVIENNSFDHSRTPEQSCPVTQGNRPLYRGNVYTSAELRAYQGTTYINGAQRLVRPLFEKAIVVPDSPNLVVQLDTSMYVDGQAVTVSGGTAAKPVVFATGQASYSVSTNRVLTGGSLSLTYSAASKKWVEAP